MMTRTKTTTSKSKPATPAASGAEDSSEENETQQPTLGEIQRSILDFKNLLSTKLDKIASDVSAINTRFDELKVSVDFNSAKIMDIEKDKFPKLEDFVHQRIQSLENKILSLEIHNRKSNLLFYGLKQKEGENINEVLKDAFVSLGIEDKVASSIAIANAHRLPRREAGAEAAQQAPTPVIARFCFMRERNFVLAAFEDLQRKRSKNPAQPGHAQQRLTVRTDLPPAMKTRRWILSNVAYKLRKEKGYATRIFVKDIKVHLQWKEKGTSKWNDYID